MFALLSGFSPAQGSILKVSVYPSEFGEEQMKKEETAAPDVWGDDDVRMKPADVLLL